MKLSINIDHVATIRNARGGKLPDPVEAARISEAAGADGIVCHLREDRRHIRDDDVKRLRASVTTKLDLEMAATKEIIGIAKRTRPELATLVPERRQELTTEGGLDVIGQRKKLRNAVEQLHDSGILVSLFVDPVKQQIEASKEIGADMIELHTGEYADATTEKARARHLKEIKAIVTFANGLGLGVNAGHGLDYTNIAPIAQMPGIAEVSIGHAIIVRAVWVGLDRAVREMVSLVKKLK
jgi:pyridoxine 5-phosphate synthase